MTLEERAKAQRKDLQNELASLEQRKRDLQLQLEVLDNLLGDETKQRNLPLIIRRGAPTKSAVLLEKLEGSSLRGSIIKILDEEPHKYFSGADMAEELLKRGFQTSAANFKHSVKTTLNILSNDNKVKSKEGEGMKLYSSIHNPEN